MTVNGINTINIDVSSASYEIKLGEGATKNLPLYLSEAGVLGKIIIITDTNVEKLHLDSLKEVLNNAGIDNDVIVIPAGEENKNLDTVSDIYDSLSKLKATRKDTILAFGGGVVGDISGFVSATYLRGIAFVQMPTTLLSVVDSSIGGKTGVDLKAGKNLIGAFKQPNLVVADTLYLKTLDDEQISSGMAEIIKAGFIMDKKLVKLLELSEDFEKDIEEFILRAINVKKYVVEKDEFEKYERMLLNFGHTFGHAIEKYYNFSGMTHGQAVAIGMTLITLDADVKNTLINILKKYNLKYETDIPSSTIVELCKNDKKSEKNSINIVVTEKIGEAQIKKLTFDELGEIYG